MAAKKKDTSSTLERLTPVLLVLTIILAFAVGMLWQKVSMMESGRTTNPVGNGAVAPETLDGKLSEEQAANVQGIQEGDFVRGNRDAEIVLIEYSDLECPFCASFHPTAVQALEEYGDQIAWVYRHFPLNFHPRAVPSANAAECVADLGGEDAFWAFIDYVFENQSPTVLGDAGLTDAAVVAGVSEAAFTECYEAERFASEVDADYDSGLEAGVTGTPGNFIMNSNGEVWVVPGAVPFDTLKLTIEEALAS